MYLLKHGATVSVTEDPERAWFPAANGIPDAAASCHTALVGVYAIERHVPAEAISKLLAERPAAIGLSLPDMPADSPGMGGSARAWASQQVMLVKNMVWFAILSNGGTSPLALLNPAVAPREG